MSPHAENSNGAIELPKLTLYTNHACPYAHRAHIALAELKIPFEEVIIDLDRPRDPWYLKVNPRGLVPSLKYTDACLKDEIITESAIVTQFLADIKPSQLVPEIYGNSSAALFRARLNFFVDTWSSKIASYPLAIMKADGLEEKEAKSLEFARAIEKEIEPLLMDAAPFFGGSSRLTLVEVQTAPFVLRLYSMCNGVLLPKSLRNSLQSLPNFSKWAKAVMLNKSVTCIWDEKAIVKKTEARIQNMKAQMK